MSTLELWLTCLDSQAACQRVAPGTLENIQEGKGCDGKESYSEPIEVQGTMSAGSLKIKHQKHGRFKVSFFNVKANIYRFKKKSEILEM